MLLNECISEKKRNKLIKKKVWGVILKMQVLKCLMEDNKRL